MNAAVLTISDRSSRGEREDRSGPKLERILRDAGYDVVDRRIIPDDRAAIVRRLRFCVLRRCALVVTTGGTGFAPRDVTPEATLEVIERRADGLVELMRSSSASSTAHAWLSRAVAGIAARTVIVDLPGTPSGATECLTAILPGLRHALALLLEDPAAEQGHQSGG